jgi:hypothetical protein
MKHPTHPLRAAAVVLAIAAASFGQAHQTPLSPSQPPAVASPLAALLPDKLSGIRATSRVAQFDGSGLAELVPDKSKAFQEYRVSAAVSREYGEHKVTLFQTQNQLTAFGLFTFEARWGRKTTDPSTEAVTDGVAMVWKDSYFVRVSPLQTGRNRPGAAIALARAVEAELGRKEEAANIPSLFEQLPESGMIDGTQRYFLGPESFSEYIERGRDMFEFHGDAEAVLAEYNQGNDPAAPAGPLKLLLVEYHTPQFATDAIIRLNEFVDALPEEERNRIAFRREGNYVIQAINISDREMADNLVGSIKYPYTVKWLRNPLWPTNDPFRVQKAAQMLISTFGLLGLILLTVLTVGSAFGATIFLKRRKRQQEIFSDAGGMLRLEIDPFERTLLGLPPKRSEE